VNGGAVFCDPSQQAAEALRAQIGGNGALFPSLDLMHRHVQADADVDTVVLGPNVPEVDAFAFADYMRVDRPTLGVILVRSQITTPLMQEALRAGVREVVDERDTLGLASAIKRSTQLTAALRESSPPPAAPLPPELVPADRRSGRVVTVFSAKGGCGKTTLATNLATALADRGNREVCLVDLDLAFGDVAIAMQLFPARTIADAVPMATTLDPGAVSAMLTLHSPGLRALVAPTDPSLSETIPASLVSELLEILRYEFDYVVIDTPPAFDDQVLAALDVSDVIALIVTPDVPALKNLKITLETLIELSYPRAKYRLVLNRADAKVGISHSEVEATAQMTLSCQIPSSRDVPASINRGVPIVQDDPKHPVSQAIRAFGEREVAPQAVPRGERQDRRGLLKKRRPRR
jgi:pilus assembly protein CpaE